MCREEKDHLRHSVSHVAHEDGNPHKSVQEACIVVANTPLAPTISKITLAAPQITVAAQPGQFIHLRMSALRAHMLRRPFGIYRTDQERGEIEIIVQSVGAGTRHLLGAEPGDTLDAIGPIGCGWHCPPDAQEILLVAGGIGAVPLYSLALQAAQTAKVQVILGAQTANLLVFQEDFEALLDKEQLYLCTDDGTVGFHGFTTEIARRLLTESKFDYLATCGPIAMQSKIAEIARDFNVFCEVSLEERMACGIGACLSCVVKTTTGTKRVCIDGPVFVAQEVIW